MTDATLNLKYGFKFQDLFNPEQLLKLDQEFLSVVENENKRLYQDLVKYREQPQSFNPLQTSELIITAAKLLEQFIADFFDINDAVAESAANTLKEQPIFAFKKWIVLRRAKRRLLRDEDLADFSELDQWLEQQLADYQDRELAVARYAITLLEDKEQHQQAIEKLTCWAIQAIKTEDGRNATAGWVSFRLPNKIDYRRLIPIEAIAKDDLKRQQLNPDSFRQRDGFNLTDPRMNEREILSEIDYCIYCHEKDGDFCSKGFPVKKGDPSQGFRKNSLDNILIGCPLDEKISEMNSLKKDGFTVGALATIMIDNPMCPATGHRICNDCMKACIYQKQDPVDIPQIETRILTDTLALPFGVEIYDLLTRWNPLRPQQWLSKPYNGLKIFIAGMGPAGFTLTHHLLMEGFAVVGADGLKIEPLPEKLLSAPIVNYDDITEALSERIMTGFGGVAEYGITVRWDKNFLKLIYISLLRRPYFQVFDGIRFGGTVTIDSLYQMGFDHVTIAVGAGLPKALPIPGSMAKGMRQANDFLMALQLTGAAKDDSLANLQLRLPAVIIGGGLTGVDTATEAQAYYIKQVEKIAERYQCLTDKHGADKIRKRFDEEGLIILDEFIEHAKAIAKERQRAASDNEKPDFIKLIRQWGGVSIIYRRNLEDSPAYTGNHEELHQALKEGLYYQSGLQPIAALVDEYHHVSHLRCQVRESDEDGDWHDNEQTIDVPARSILVATGASPNVAYDFENHEVLKRTHLQYDNYECIDDQLQRIEDVEHIKQPDFGPFTSYDEKGNKVSFIGDVHPVFHGNVVGAIASALRTYPKITALFEGNNSTADDYEKFKQTMQQQFHCHIESIERVADDVLELTVTAPAAAKQFQPGQFFRIQNYEANAPQLGDTKLRTEPIALLGAGIEGDVIKLMVIERGASSRICSTFKEGQRIALMGPTGVRTKIPTDKQNILIIGNQMGLAYVRAVAPALKKAGNHVTFLGYFDHHSQLYCREEIEALVDHCIWCLNNSQDPIIRLNEFAKNPDSKVALINMDRITILGDHNVLRQFQAARSGILTGFLKHNVKIYGTVYSTMQCMMKGVCAQCLQWQIDPRTKERKKAVFACSWQDQPLELVDFDNYAERVAQNQVAETMANLWLDYIYENGQEHTT